MGCSFLRNLCLIALFGTLYVAVAQTSYKNITLGWSLIASDNSASWPSPSGEFAFGFHRLENQNLYLLSIWFDKLPDKTLVWYANGDNPAPQGSKVELGGDGQFILTNPAGEEIWRPNSSPVGVVSAAMLDTGNFILVNSDSSSAWQSFDDPADTLLPSQVLTAGGSISARTTEENFTTGRFELRLRLDGNLVLNTIAPTGNAYDVYYQINTVGAPGGMTGYQLIFNPSGDLYINKTNGETVNVTSGNIGTGFPAKDYHHRATIDYDGVLRLYAYPKTSRNGIWAKNWSTVWFAPDNICLEMVGENGGGSCGFNSYCLLEADGRPNCQCIPGFSFSDPDNKLKGCEQDAILKCNLGDLRPEDVYVMQQLNNLRWDNSSNYEELHSYTDDQCKISCLCDCNCLIVVSIGGICWKKKLPVSNGRQRPTSIGRVFVKKLISNRSSGELDTRLNFRKRSHNTFSLVAAILLGSSGFLNFLLAAIILLIILRSHDGRTKLRRLPSLLDTNLRIFTYEDLKAATSKFEEELGRGSFGIVYKGVMQLSSSQVLVAVKKLDKIAQEGEKEFKTEASVIAKIHHKNLVRLIGFCDEGPHKLLVYEFMSNGSLASFLFGDTRPEWGKRIQFAYGIARGLMYLHEECSTQIIHCDIKPQNILLDDSFTAKISDFGIAKLLISDLGH